MIRLFVGVFRVGLRRVGVGRSWGMGHIPKLSKGFGCHPRKLVRLIVSFGVSFGHIEFPIRAPVESVKGVFAIAEIGVNDDILVGLVVAV